MNTVLIPVKNLMTFLKKKQNICLLGFCQVMKFGFMKEKCYSLYKINHVTNIYPTQLWAILDYVRKPEHTDTDMTGKLHRERTWHTPPGDLTQDLLVVKQPHYPLSPCVHGTKTLAAFWVPPGSKST